MEDNVLKFQEHHPSIESYWRSIILFGNNVASYKFALSEALLDFAKEGKINISYDELAVPYSKYICEHLKSAPKQTTSSNSKFLTACKMFNKKDITYDELIKATVENGFIYVLDAFHNVNRKILPIEFYKKEKNKILLTDEIYKINELKTNMNFRAEIESRWKLVETAWEQGINRSLLNINYDYNDEILFINNNLKRRNITSVRGALNGYQKSKCFYCNDDIIVSDDKDNTCDVDHFFPHVLNGSIKNINFDGVWNLVLTCHDCNRGVNGKFCQVPTIKYLSKLNDRNNYLISSHHPLRETIMNQTGSTEALRNAFLNSVDKLAIEKLINRWEPKELKNIDIL